MASFVKWQMRLIEAVKSGDQKTIDYCEKIFPKDIEKIVLIGCGTAYHSCATAKYWFEELTNIPIEINNIKSFISGIIQP